MKFAKTDPKITRLRLGCSKLIGTHSAGSKNGNRITDSGPVFGIKPPVFFSWPHPGNALHHNSPVHPTEVQVGSSKNLWENSTLP